jgi:hypothetical protein
MDAPETGIAPAQGPFGQGPRRRVVRQDLFEMRCLVKTSNGGRIVQTMLVDVDLKCVLHKRTRLLIRTESFVLGGLGTETH